LILLLLFGCSKEEISPAFAQLFPHNPSLGEEFFLTFQEMHSQYQSMVYKKESPTDFHEGNVFQFLLGLHLLLIEYWISLTTNSNKKRLFLSLSQLLERLSSVIHHCQPSLPTNFFQFYSKVSLSLQPELSMKERFNQLIVQNYRFQFESQYLINQLKLVLQNCFFFFHFFSFLNQPNDMDPVGKKTSAAANVINTFIQVVRSYYRPISLTSNEQEAIQPAQDKSAPLSEDQWSKVLYSLPVYFRYLIHLSLEQCKLSASSSWPITILKWMDRNDLCGKMMFNFNLILDVNIMLISQFDSTSPIFLEESFGRNFRF
jgi:hypothetical protein